MKIYRKDGDEEDAEMVGELKQQAARATTNNEDNSLQKAMSGIFASKRIWLFILVFYFCDGGFRIENISLSHQTTTSPVW